MTGLVSVSGPRAYVLSSVRESASSFKPQRRQLEKGLTIPTS